MGRDPGGRPGQPGSDLSGRDNLRAGPVRPTGVAEPDGWESTVRRSLTDRAGAAPPSPPDLAHRVLTRGRRAHRRRTAGTLMAVLAATTVLATGGMLYDGRTPTAPTGELGPVTGLFREPEVAPPQEPVSLAAGDQLAPALGVDLLGDGAAGGTVLATADGVTVPLDRRIRQVRVAQPRDGGYAVVAGEPGSMRLWWVMPDQPPRSLLTGMDAIVVAGDRVAWQRGGMLALATLTGPELIGRATTVGLDEAGYPVGIVGGSVLLRRAQPDGTAVAWDSWQPADGSYRPGWSDRVRRIYGPLADGSALGLVATAQGCLARLDPVDFTPRQTRCLGRAIPPDAPAGLSPGQRWLLLATGAEPALVDLAALFDGPAERAVTPVPGVVPLAVPPSAHPGQQAVGEQIPGEPTVDVRVASAAGYALSSGVVWPGPDQVVLTGADRLTSVWPGRLRAGDTGAVAEFPLPVRPPVVVGSGS